MWVCAALSGLGIIAALLAAPPKMGATVIAGDKARAEQVATLDG
jgi:hypothetical protein